MKKPKESELKFAIVATDAVVLAFVEDKLSVLLIEPTNPDYKGKLALIGGLIHPKETAEDSVKRHIKEQGGIIPAYLEQVHTFSALDRDTRGRVISVAYLALVPPDKASKKAEKAIWTPVKKAKDLAYDHDEILKEAIKRLRERILATDAVRFLMPKEFTLTALQNAYEQILNKKLDKRNFRKKILSLGWLEETGKKDYGTYRPAALYRFVKKRGQAQIF